MAYNRRRKKTDSEEQPKRPTGRPKLTEEEKQKRRKAYEENPDIYKKAHYSLGKPESVCGGALADLERYCNATDEEVSQLMGNVVKWYRLGKIAPVKTDEECKQRLDAFFEYLIRTGEKPSVEKMALSLGVTVRAMEYWKRGEKGSAMRQAIISLAYQTLAAMDAELVNNGKIPQVVYIFRSKNFFDMRDQTEIYHHSDNRKDIDEEELRKRILGQVIIDEAQDADFVDVSEDTETDG